MTTRAVILAIITSFVWVGMLIGPAKAEEPPPTGTWVRIISPASGARVAGIQSLTIAWHIADSDYILGQHACRIEATPLCEYAPPCAECIGVGYFDIEARTGTKSICWDTLSHPSCTFLNGPWRLKAIMSIPICTPPYGPPPIPPCPSHAITVDLVNLVITQVTPSYLKFDPESPTSSRTITFVLDDAKTHITQATISIYTTDRLPVRTITSYVIAPGVNTCTWDGKLDDGSLAPKGIYIFSLSVWQGYPELCYSDGQWNPFTHLDCYDKNSWCLSVDGTQVELTSYDSDTDTATFHFSYLLTSYVFTEGEPRSASAVVIRVFGPDLSVLAEVLGPTVSNAYREPEPVWNSVDIEIPGITQPNRAGELRFVVFATDACEDSDKGHRRKPALEMNAKNDPVVTVILDYGHGPGHAGTAGTGRYGDEWNEITANTKMGELISEALRQHNTLFHAGGAKMIYALKFTDRRLSAGVRPANVHAMLQRLKPTQVLFVSVHHNGTNDLPPPTRTEVYYHTEADHSNKLAKGVLDTVAGILSPPRSYLLLQADHRKRMGLLKGLRRLRPGLPAALVEVAFLTTEYDEDLVYNCNDSFCAFFSDYAHCGIDCFALWKWFGENPCGL